MRTFRRWYWALLPLLAIVAYVTVLRVGFQSDDFILLYERRINGFDPSALLPQPYPYWRFYRPVGWFLTWDLNWLLWGYNALPFHLMGLLLHGAAALLLGLWVAELSSRKALGWLAGALFAVFPLHIETVGWIASQWDIWAACFAFLSLLLFTRWW